MLIDYITSYCNDCYENRQKCDNCTYGSNCPGNCGKCLEYVHFPDRAPADRKYDCQNMADFYTCKYSYKYMSEIVYALKNIEYLKVKDSLKVMSIGCGPCTDLFSRMWTVYGFICFRFFKKKIEYIYLINWTT